MGLPSFRYYGHEYLLLTDLQRFSKMSEAAVVPCSCCNQTEPGPGTNPTLEPPMVVRTSEFSVNVKEAVILRCRKSGCNLFLQHLFQTRELRNDLILILYLFLLSMLLLLLLYSIFMFINNWSRNYRDITQVPYYAQDPEDQLSASEFVVTLRHLPNQNKINLTIPNSTQPTKHFHAEPTIKF